jgi:hypothetical protein
VRARDPRRRVPHDDAARRRDAKALGRKQEHLWVGLAALDMTSLADTSASKQDALSSAARIASMLSGAAAEATAQPVPLIGRERLVIPASADTFSA